MRLVSLLGQRTPPPSLARPAPPLPAGGGRRARVWYLLVAVILIVATMAGAFVMGALLHRDGTLTELFVEYEAHTMRSVIRGIFGPRERLPEVRIDMKFKNLQKIAAKREDALRARILDSSDDDFVKADWSYQGRTLPVAMRLKGDWVDHLHGEKWSYRVEVDGDETFLGLRRFSIQHPATRNYLFEWAYLEHLRGEDIPAPRYEFAHVWFNGRDLGIYAVEEHFSKELIESQRRRAGLIVKYDETTLWRQRTHNAKRQGPYTDAFLFDPDDGIFDPNAFTAPIDVFGGKKIAANPTLAAERDAAVGLLRGYSEGRLEASEVFDIERTGKFLAIVDLWSAEHQLDWHNLRFYYNPITGRLEPIGFDGEPPVQPAYLLLSPWWSLDLVKDPAVASVYVRELRRMITPAYLAGLEQRMGARYAALQSALVREFGLLPAPWTILTERARRIAIELAPVKGVIAISERPPGAAADRVSIRNVAALPVEIGGVRVAGEQTEPALALLAAGQSGAVVRGEQVYLRPTSSSRAGAAAEYVSFASPPLGGRTEPPALEVLYRLAGDEAWSVETVAAYPAAMTRTVLPEGPTIEEILSQRDYLIYDADARELVVRPGTWDVAGNLVLPAGVPLRLGAGTTLRFDAGAYLLATAPLRLAGTREEPVVLRPRAESWGGVVVIRAGGESTWHEVEVRDTAGVNIAGLGLLGGVNFYESPLAAVDCRFLGSSAEDMLNAIRGRVHLLRVEIAGGASDAIDGDFIDGEVTDSSFHDIVGDAIDVSGSTLTVTRVAALRLGDKAISAGEGSTITLFELAAEDVGIGIAAKDRSRVDAAGVRVRNARVAALAAYTKKPEFGPGILMVTGLDEEGSETRTLVHAGSTLEIDGIRVEGTELDVKQLYAAGILGN